MIFFISTNSLASDLFLIGSCIFLILLFLLLLLWNYLEWRNDFYLITGKRVINLNKHLITSDSKFEIPLSAINNLEIRKSLLGRSFGFGDLVIKTFTGETILKNMTSPSEVQAFLEILLIHDKTCPKN